MGRNFETDVSVGAAGLVVNRTKDVGRRLYVFDGDSFVQLPNRSLAILRQHFLQAVIVIGAAANRFLKDCRITGDTAQTVLFHKTFQLATADQLTANEIEPYRLALIQKLS